MGGLLAVDDNIVVRSLSDGGELSAPEHLSAHRLWLNLKSPNTLPAWRDLQPEQLSPIIPFVMVVEDYDDDGEYRVRLAGSLVNAVLGGLLKDQPISHLPERDWIPFLRAGIENAKATGKPTLVTRRLIESPAHSQRLATLFLPFVQDEAGRHIILAINRIEEG